MSQKFIPSERSDVDRTTAQLRYLQKAAKMLEAQMGVEGDLPSWVTNRISKAAVEMGIATSYILHLQEKKERQK